MKKKMSDNLEIFFSLFVFYMKLSECLDRPILSRLTFQAYLFLFRTLSWIDRVEGPISNREQVGHAGFDRDVRGVDRLKIHL